MYWIVYTNQCKSRGESMINTSQTTTYNLTLTAEQFDDLYDTVQEEIYQISDALEGTDLTLNDYGIYHIFKQMNRFKGLN